MTSLPSHDRAIFHAAGNRRAGWFGIVVIAAIAGLCLFLGWLAWLAWTKIENPRIRHETALMTLAPIIYLWMAIRASGRAIRYEIAAGELFVFRGRREFFIPLSEIAEARRLADKEFFNADLRSQGKSRFSRPIFYNDRRIVRRFNHLRFGPVMVCANRSPEYCLLTLTGENDPKLLLSPERPEEFLDLLHK